MATRVPARGTRPESAGSVATFAAGPVLAFFALAYAFSWAWIIPWAATGHVVRQGEGWPTHLPSLLGPLLAAIVVTFWTDGRPAVGDLVRRMGHWRIGWHWWLAVLSPLLFFPIVLGLLEVAGADLPARNDFARFS